MSRQDPEEPERQIRRILVALNCSLRSLEAIESAAELAAGWKAELSGLFVEDSDLLRLAAAPFATRFLFPAASEEPFTVSRMESEFRALQDRARRELARAAARARVNWSFHTVRGRLLADILAAAAEDDVLSLAGAGWPMGSRARLGSAPHARGRGAPARHSLPEPPILVVYDGSTGSEDASRLAARLAKAQGKPLTVLFFAPSGRLDLKTEAKFSRLAAAENLKLRFRAIDSQDRPGFLRAVRSEEGEVLVLSADSALFEQATIDALLHETDTRLLIMPARSRPGPAHRPAGRLR